MQTIINRERIHQAKAKEAALCKCKQRFKVKPMKIYKIIADRKPNHCVECPLSVKHICGTEVIEHPTSGSAIQIRVPDKRCKIKAVDD